MAQLQNHGGNTRLYVCAANALTKDKAVSRVKVCIDTSQWSSRKRNIITKSLMTGVAACGWETAEIVDQLAQLVGSSVNKVSKWQNYVLRDEVKPEKLDELLAYTAAWLRMDPSARETGHNYYFSPKQKALQALDRGETLRVIPLNDSMTYDEKREFIHKYLKASEDREHLALKHLIERIKNGETIELEYAN